MRWHPIVNGLLFVAPIWAVAGILLWLGWP